MICIGNNERGMVSLPTWYVNVPFFSVGCVGFFRFALLDLILTASRVYNGIKCQYGTDVEVEVVSNQTVAP